MAQITLKLSSRVVRLLKHHAELSGRTVEDELLHGIMMHFDPEYSAAEGQRLIEELQRSDAKFFDDDQDIE